MLIKIAGHYIENPNHIDKLIAIKGLPDEWIFRTSKYGGRELLSPWVPDYEENIPKEIRHLCEPTEITKVFPPIEKGRDPVVDVKTILAIKFDFMTQPGQELWEKVERYLERMTPRDRPVPKPVIMAPDHKSAFNPHACRKTMRGSLEFYSCEIPDIDLREPVLAKVETATAAPMAPVIVQAPSIPVIQPVKVAQIPPAVFPCPESGCSKVFSKAQALRMHSMKMHGVRKQPAGVS